MIPPIAFFMGLAGAAAQADLVRYTFTGDVRVPASPLYGATIELRAQFDLGTAPTLTLSLPDENRYSMTALDHWLRITGASAGNGKYTAVAPAAFGAQDELPPSTDLDSLTYNGVFPTTIGDVGLTMITLFLDPSVFATIASSPPVFDPSKAFLIIMTHTVDGVEYNISGERVQVEVFPDGTALPEASTPVLCLFGLVAAGTAAAFRRRRRAGSPPDFSVQTA
jgi:hypothetical protein